MEVSDLLEKFNDKYNDESSKDFDTFYSEFQNYYIDTITSRTGDVDSNPVEEIRLQIKYSKIGKSFLFLGHRGCGKSTELVRLRKMLLDDGQIPFVIDTQIDLDPQNLKYTDLLVLILEQLLVIAEEKKIKIDNKTLTNINSFWDEVEIEKKAICSGVTSIDGESKLGISIPNLITLFARVKSELKIGFDSRETIRTHVKNKISQFVGYIEEIATLIGNNKLVLIFENLDKVDLGIIGDIFKKYSGTLTGFSFHTIYTFPISLYYNNEFTHILSSYELKLLPMIKVTDIDGREYSDGVNKLQDIVFKRANKDLFENGAISTAINISGGSIRTLFRVLTSASLKALVGNSSVVRKSDVEKAIVEIMSEYGKRLVDEDITNLKEIMDSEDKTTKKVSSNLAKTMDYLDNMFILEYNGVRWFDVNPIVKEYIKGLEKSFE